MFKAILIDDEPNARATLRQEIDLHCPEIRIIGEAGSVAEGVALLQKQPTIDLLFLDIQLTDGAGFEILEQVDYQLFKTIFITAYSDYALKAIKFQPLDYLLKPIDAEDLRDAVDKAIQTQQASFNQQMRQFMQQYKSAALLPERIALATADGIHLYPVRSIVRMAAEGNYTSVFFENGKKLLLAKTLKEMEESVTLHRFERIHKSHLVNLEHIQSYVNRFGGEVVMSDGTELPVAQRKKGYLLQLLSKIG
ncbi:MAG: LytTR family DNA-binding domain-containing protein [Saprospiraceae bacterium]|jgi:two-component system LytT family response regulator|nr:LytTR family DNA-binding domain-containing protein [Saprospiraceae bacterium]